MTVGGFWSYTHADDVAEFGRIADLARDIVQQYQLLTGETIELFLDRDSIEWGNAWIEKVDGSLATVAFFIPVLTPRFFVSTECRREMRIFINRAERLGLTELIMPILYVDFPALYDDPQTDDLMKAATDYQWEDWTDLRFEERQSGAYRQAVFKLATRLAKANALADSTPTPLLEIDTDVDDDTPGLMDLIAEGESVLPLWAATVDRATELLSELGPAFDVAGQEMRESDARGKGFAGRLTTARKLAARLDPIGDEIVAIGNEFATQLASVDSAVRAIVEMAGSTTPEDRAEIEPFFESVREMAAQADTGLGTLQEFLDQMPSMEKMSRDLRRPFGKLRKGFTVMHEGRDIINAWVDLVDGGPGPTAGPVT